VFKSMGNLWTSVTGVLTAISGAMIQFDVAPEGFEGWAKAAFVIGLAVFGVFAKDGKTGSAPGAKS